MRLAEVEIGEEPPATLRVQPRRQDLAEDIAAAAHRAPHLVELGEPAVEPVQPSGHGVRDEAGGVDAARGQKLGQGEAIPGQARRE
jgi:hypothetical protein